MKKVILLFVAALSFTACHDDDNGKDIRMIVNYYQETCNRGEAPPGPCYLVQQDEQIGTNEWSHFSDSIEGFEYEEDYVYDLKVHAEKIKNPPQDASDTKYTLINVNSKTKVQ